MMDQELNDKIKQILEACHLHLKRMLFAKEKVRNYIPLTRNNYNTMDEDTIGFLDQYIYRFSKLQDAIGSRLFPSLLESLAEPTEEKAFIDILNRLEKLGIIDSAIGWIQVRKIRNDIAHEYPSSIDERIEGMNLLFEKIDMMKIIVEKCQSTISKQTIKTQSQENN